MIRSALANLRLAFDLYATICEALVIGWHLQLRPPWLGGGKRAWFVCVWAGPGKPGCYRLVRQIRSFDEYAVVTACLDHDLSRYTIGWRPLSDVYVTLGVSVTGGPTR